MRDSEFSGFYASEPDAILAALAALREVSDVTGRVVSSHELQWRPGDPPDPRGLWSAQLFGDGDRWAVIELADWFLHPQLAGVIADLLGIRAIDVEAIAGYRAWYEHGAARVPPGHPGIGSGDYPLDAWPPYPPYPTEESWRAALRRQGVRDDRPIEEIARDWFAERGLDEAAIEADDRRWEDTWVDRSGPIGLSQALQSVADPCRARFGVAPEHLLIDRIPVPPIELRPSLPSRGGFVDPGRINRALADAISRNSRFARLIELNAPPLILRHESIAVAGYIAEVLASMRGEPPPPRPTVDRMPSCGGAPPTTPVWPVPETFEQVRAVQGVAFVSDTHGLIDFATTTFLLDVTTGQVEAAWPSGGLGLVGATPDRLAWYVSGLDWKFHFYDLDAASWRDGPLPPDVPFAFYESHEASFLVDRETGQIRHLAAVADYPTSLVISPCGDYLFAADKEDSGGVYRRDGTMQFPSVGGTWFDSPVLHADGVIDDDEPDDGLFEPLCAVAYCEGRDAWYSAQNNALFHGLDELIKLAFPTRAAGFHRRGDRLLIASTGRLFVLAVDERPDILACWDVRPLQQLLVGALAQPVAWDDDDDSEWEARDRGDDARAEVTPAALNAALYATGTLAEAAALSVDQIAALNAACSYDEPALVGEPAARAIVAASQQARVVASVPPVAPDERRASRQRAEPANTTPN